mmetsp:Transcript_5278/g.11691  ORF Transcript_5278/g.11691 Transcript_5278/m.11691 type:complete len:202 (-) Transcript_5278:136-741(-)
MIRGMSWIVAWEDRTGRPLLREGRFRGTDAAERGPNVANLSGWCSAGVKQRIQRRMMWPVESGRKQGDSNDARSENETGDEERERAHYIDEEDDKEKCSWFRQAESFLYESHEPFEKRRDCHGDGYASRSKKVHCNPVPRVYRSEFRHSPRRKWRKSRAFAKSRKGHDGANTHIHVTYGSIRDSCACTIRCDFGCCYFEIR